MFEARYRANGHVNKVKALPRLSQKKVLLLLSIIWGLIVGLYDIFPESSLLIISELTIFFALALHSEKLFEKKTAIKLMGIIYTATLAIALIGWVSDIPFRFSDFLNAFISIYLLVLFFASLSLPESGQALMRKYCLSYVILLLGIVSIMPFHNLTAYHTLTTQDALLFRLELLYGMDLPFMLGKFLHEQNFLHVFIGAIYSSVPTVLILTMLLQHASEETPRGDILFAFILSGLGSLCYLVVPGVGPIVGLGKNWFEMADSSQSIEKLLQVFPPNFPRNCVPSLHTAAALLFFFASLDFGKFLCSAYAFFAGGTIIACLGLGEHYTVDIIMALPFSIAVWALTRRKLSLPKRFWLFSVFLALTLAWIPLMYFIVDAASPALLWGLTIFTTLSSIAGFYFIEKDTEKSFSITS